MQKRQDKTTPSAVAPQTTTSAAVPVSAPPQAQAVDERGAALRQLQQSYGNRYVQGLIGQARANHSQTPLIQPKLILGPVNDPYEHQADRVAQQMGRGVSPAGANLGGNRLMRQPTYPSGPAAESGLVNPSVQQAIQGARGGGQPLAEPVRARFEQALGADFSQVRVHTDAESDHLNHALQARAFTTGRDIFFRQGHFAPTSAAGQTLLAHELTHTIQQGAAPQIEPGESALANSHPVHTFAGGQQLYLKPAFANTIQRAKFLDEKGKVAREITEIKSPDFKKFLQPVLDAWGLPQTAEVRTVIQELLQEEYIYHDEADFAEHVYQSYEEFVREQQQNPYEQEEKEQGFRGAKPGLGTRVKHLLSRRGGQDHTELADEEGPAKQSAPPGTLKKIATAAKLKAASASKSVKHATRSGMTKTKLKLGVSSHYTGGQQSSDQEHLGLLSTEIPSGDWVHEETESIKSDKGALRKGAGGLLKLVAGNFIEAGAAASKARRVGKVKKDIEFYKQYTSTRAVSMQDADLEEILQEHADLSDLIQMANSLKGALKRQVVWESTVGTIKQGISVGAMILFGAPGVGDLAGAGASQLASFTGAKVSGGGVGVIGEKLASSRLGKRFKTKGDKLDEDDWNAALTDFLHHPNPYYRKVTRDMVAALFKSDQKAQQFIAFAKREPRQAAKLLVARQKGVKTMKKALKTLRKTQEGLQKITQADATERERAEAFLPIEEREY